MLRAEGGARGNRGEGGSGSSPPLPTISVGRHRARLEERTIDSAFHEFRVDYEQAKNHNIGQPISSNAFSAGGHMWRVHYFPNGIEEELDGKYLSIMIQLVNESRNVSAILEAFILGKDGEPCSRGAESCFSLCTVMPCLGMTKIGGPPFEMMQKLLVAADRYALDRLKLICAQKLCDDMSVDTVAATLVCAEMYSCPELKSQCIDFFAVEDNFKKAVLTRGFVELGQMFPSIIDELRERVGL
nr:unnamed protein product [Digitaria exilis]